MFTIPLVRTLSYIVIYGTIYIKVCSLKTTPPSLHLVNDLQETTCVVRETNILGVHYNSYKKPVKKRENYAKDCKEIQRKGENMTGIYEIYPQHAQAPFPVLCDMDIRGGGWTIIQKRFDGSQDFFLEWRNYKFGFGNLEGFGTTELLVEIVSRNNEYGYAYYSSFAIGPEPGGYKLESLSGYRGDIGDCLASHHGSKFSTKDLDFTNKNCATIYPGGWWYQDCLCSNLNGKHINIDLPPKYKHQGLQWDTFKENGNSHSKSRMLVRSIN